MNDLLQFFNFSKSAFPTESDPSRTSARSMLDAEHEFDSAASLQIWAASAALNLLIPLFKLIQEVGVDQDR